MLSLPYTFLSIVTILAFASTWFLISAAPWWDNLKYSFGRLGWTFSWVMRVSCGNNTVSIVCYKFIICEDFIFFEIYKRSLGIFSFRLTELVLRVCTLTHRLVCIGLKSNKSTPSCILICEWSTCFFVEPNTVRIHTHLMNNDVCVSSGHEFFRELGIALKIHISSLASLAFKV